MVMPTAGCQEQMKWMVGEIESCWTSVDRRQLKLEGKTTGMILGV